MYCHLRLPDHILSLGSTADSVICVSLPFFLEAHLESFHILMPVSLGDYMGWKWCQIIWD